MHWPLALCGLLTLGGGWVRPVAELAIIQLHGGQATGSRSRGQEPLFPFVISYDVSENVTNLSGWHRRPAGRDGFVRVRQGHLATDAGPVRFLGTNLCFEACFPSHRQAERLAARLARFGINVVRLHHMDSRSIWGDSPNKLTIDPKKLERLDYLIYQLKQHGIYVNINLHVSRWFGPAEGFPARQQRPKYDKGLDNFEPRMIELQKKYARDLLSHVNPYTRAAYTREPAVAFVEISNEDALFTVWGRGQLDGLPEPYAATFRKQWNRWLRGKYGNTERLGAAWNTGATPLGDQMLSNGRFENQPGRAWRLERDDRTEVQWSVVPNGPGGRRCLRLVVTRQGRQPWRPQLVQPGLSLRKGTAYTLACYLRSDRPRRIGINCMMAHRPWERLGLSVNVQVGPEWRRHRFTFIAERDDSNARITFTGLKPGTYELADVSLRPGGVLGLEPGQRLEDDSVAVPKRSQTGRTETVRRDFIDFLWETERDYWWGMYRFLKDELGLRSLVCGTQLSYSPVHIQAGLDYIDAHAYWQHPRFPGRPWDRNNWYVNNVAMVNSPGGTLSGLAARRVAGLPFTVSEYNHPQPNQYGAEGYPMLAAIAALQDWDAIYSFAYCHDQDFEPRRISNYFDIKCNPSKLAHMPACAALFVRGDMAPARQQLWATLTAQAERTRLYETGSPWRLTADELGLDSRLALMHRIGLDIGQAGRAQAGAPPDSSRPSSGRPKPPATPEPPAQSRPQPTLPDQADRFASDTGQLLWDVSQSGAGYFMADTPRTKLLTGFISGRRFQLGNVAITVGPTRLGWATVSLVCIDGSGFGRPGRVLVAATGLVQNRGAELEHLGANRVTLRTRWGTEPVLCEGLPAEIDLPSAPSRVRLYPLDEAGNRRQAVPAATGRDGKALLKLLPEYRTIWYEVEMR